MSAILFRTRFFKHNITMITALLHTKHAECLLTHWGWDQGWGEYQIYEYKYEYEYL